MKKQMKKTKKSKLTAAAKLAVSMVKEAPEAVPAAPPAPKAPSFNDILAADGATTLIVGKDMAIPVQQHPKYGDIAMATERLTTAYLCGMEMLSKQSGLKISPKIFLMTSEVSTDGGI